MSRRKKKQKVPGKELVNISIDNMIHNYGNSKGLTRLLFPLMQQIQSHYRVNSGQVVCGYSGQPLYINKEYTEITGRCVLDPKKICSYTIPSEGIAESCMTYKLKVLG